MNAFARSRQADRRFWILKFTADGNGSCNSAMLRLPLEDMGHTPPAESLRSDLAALLETGCIEMTNEKSGVLFAGDAVVSWTITEKGSDVAAGRKKEPGIRQPAPHERE